MGVSAGGEAAKGAGEAGAAKGATDAAAAGAADAGAATAGGALAADAGAGALAADAGTAALAGGAADAGTAALASGAADAGLGAAGLGATSAIPAGIEGVTVLGSAGGGGLGALGTATAAGLGGAALGSALAGGGGGGTAAAPSMLQATGDSSVSGLSPDVANMLGVDSGGLPAAGDSIGGAMPTGFSGDAAAAGDVSSENIGTLDYPTPDAGTVPDIPVAGASMGDKLAAFLKNPKNLASLGLGGISALNALSQPKLPGAARTALGTAGPAAQQAIGILQSGGTSAPIYSQQKASIDATIDEQIRTQSEALLQNAANSGEGGVTGPNGQVSGVVQQQINQLKTSLEARRQQLYLQAQQQNVSQALSELSGGNQVLDQVAQLQFNQSQDARQAAAQTAELAGILYGT